MSSTSNWPLPVNGIRFITPQSVRQTLEQHPLAGQLYPHSLGYYPHALGHQMQREQHDDYLLIYCSAGQGEFQTPQSKQAVRAGDVLLIPPGIAHAYQADNQKPWTIYWCHFAGDQAELFQALLAPYLSPEGLYHFGIHRTFIDDFTRLLSVRNRGYQLSALLHASTMLQQLLTQLIQAQETPDTSNSVVSQLQELMRQRLHQQLTLDELVEHSHLSRYHLIRLYKQHTGYAPLQHFLHLKMEYACQRLDQTRHPVSQIATELGYQDPYYFSRQFKKIIGLSPRAYRSLKV